MRNARALFQFGLKLFEIAPKKVKYFTCCSTYRLKMYART